jgi:uncharacterized protein (UPF0333 family)
MLIRLKKRKGQSTLEYLIIIVVIITLIIVVATGVFKDNISNILDRVSRKPTNMVNATMLPD